MGRQPMNKDKVSKVSQIIGLVLFFSIVSVMFLIMGGLRFVLLSRMFSISAVIFIGAFSTTILLRKNGQLDLSFVAVAVFGAYFFTLFYNDYNLSLLLAIGLTLLACAIIGTIHGVLVDITPIPSIAITFVSFFLIRKLTYELGGLEHKLLDRDITGIDGYNFGIASSTMITSIIILIMILGVGAYIVPIIRQKKDENKQHSFLDIIALVLWVLMTGLLCLAMFVESLIPNVIVLIIALFAYTNGYIYYMKRSSRLNSILGFTNSSVMAGVAGIFYIMRTSSYSPLLLEGMTVPIISAALLGGASIFGHRGNAKTSFVGSLIVSIIMTTMMFIAMKYNLQVVVAWCVLGIAILYNLLLYFLFERKRYPDKYILGIQLDFLRKRS